MFFISLNFKDNRPTLLNQTLSGKKQVRQIGSQYFSFTVSMPPLQQEKAQEVFAFLQKQKGSFEDFTIVAPLDNLGAGNIAIGLYIEGEGNVTFHNKDGVSRTVAVPDNFYLICSIKRVLNTGTTATGIHALVL